MDSIEIIIKDKLTRIGKQFKPSGADFILSQCISPAHKDTHGSFGINLTTGVGKCFTCGFSVGTEYWIGEGELTEEQEEELLVQAQYTTLRGKLKQEDTNTHLDVMLPPFGAMVEYGWRGFTGETIKEFGLYKVTVGKYANRVVFPFFNKGKVTGFTTRALYETPTKYLHNKGFQVKKILYPFDQLRKMDCETLLVVEGTPDAISGCQLKLPAMANFGVAVNISPEKVRELYSLGVERLVLMFDEDAAGLEAVEDFKNHPLIADNFEVITGRQYPPLREFYASGEKDLNAFLELLLGNEPLSE